MLINLLLEFSGDLSVVPEKWDQTDAAYENFMYNWRLSNASKK